MSLELLKPISENLLEELDENQLQGSLFNKIKFHSEQSGIPNIDSSNLCIIGISEIRNSYFELCSRQRSRPYLYEICYSSNSLF